MTKEEKEQRKQELISRCKYYKGEAESPYDGGYKDLLWGYELAWVNMPDDGKQDLLNEFRALTLPENDGTPESLQALLYNRFSNWNMCGVDEFKHWYAEVYKRG